VPAILVSRTELHWQLIRRHVGRLLAVVYMLKSTEYGGQLDWGGGRPGLACWRSGGFEICLPRLEYT